MEVVDWTPHVRSDIYLHVLQLILSLGSLADRTGVKGKFKSL